MVTGLMVTGGCCCGCWRGWGRSHIVRGRFFTGSSAGPGASAPGCPIVMDAGVWSKLPADILWRVLVLLPAAKQAQLQLVCRKWRHLLTSADFHNAAAAHEQQSEQGQRVIACATPGGDDASSSSSSATTTSTLHFNRLEVVDVDLTFLPLKCFWKSDADYNEDHLLCSGGGVQAAGLPRYFVLAAADGLVCIANDTDLQSAQVCVFSPLTRTYRMLPALPREAALSSHWLLTAATGATTTVTTLACTTVSSDHREPYLDWAVATCELASGGGAQWAVTRGRVQVSGGPAGLGSLTYVQQGLMALCGGAVFWFLNKSLRVLEVAAKAGLSSEAVPGALDVPSVALLGLDDATAYYHEFQAFLVAHRGTVFLIAHLYDRGGHGPLRPHALVPCGLWRLARCSDGRMEWHPVARLDAAALKRLTGLGFSRHGRRVNSVFAAFGVRELLCCGLEVGYWELEVERDPARLRVRYMLGYNLDTGLWELVHDDQGLLCVCSDSRGLFARPMELRPHLFLS